MKRILGTIVAIAGVLAFSPVADAALVNFDLTGVIGTWSRSGDANAAVPPDGGDCGATGMGSTTPGSATTCFRYAFLAGSSITVDITGSAVTMIGGDIYLGATTPLVFGTIVLTTSVHSIIAGGATGTLVGDSILWTTAANTALDPASTIECNGPNCALISMPEATPLPFEPTFTALTNSTGVTALNLGQWDLNALHDTIVGSTTAVTRWSNVATDGNRRVGGYTFGPNLLGLPVPEPASGALVLLGLGALALRSRKA